VFYRDVFLGNLNEKFIREKNIPKGLHELSVNHVPFTL
jgi:hypothetical protein